jgi:hypothetical protein
MAYTQSKYSILWITCITILPLYIYIRPLSNSHDRLGSRRGSFKGSNTATMMHPRMIVLIYVSLSDLPYASTTWSW